MGKQPPTMIDHVSVAVASHGFADAADWARGLDVADLTDDQIEQIAAIPNQRHRNENPMTERGNKDPHPRVVHCKRDDYDVYCGPRSAQRRCQYRLGESIRDRP